MAQVQEFSIANTYIFNGTDWVPWDGAVTGAAAGTQYTEDAAAAANPVGNALMLVRVDTPASTVSANGDNVAQRGTDYGSAYVTLLDSSGNIISTFGGGTQYTEADTDASITGTASLTEGPSNTLTPLQSNAAKDLLVAVNAAIPAGTNNIGDIDVLSIIPGSGATNLGKAEDAPHSTGDVGVMALAVRQTAQADFGADGDYVPMSIDDDGGLRVSIIAGAGSGGTAAADDADFVAGTTSGTPAMGVYESTPTNVTDGDLGTVGITTGRRLKTSATIDAALPAGTNNIGDVDILSIPKASTATLSNVNDSATSVTLLSATAGRLGAILANDSTASALVKFGTTASSTSYTKKLLPGEAWDIGLGLHIYTGRIDCIWESDASGAMRITELTA